MTINDGDFERLVAFVRARFGINLERKRQLIDARLSFDISRRGYTDFSRYVAKVLSEPDGEECRRMMNRLSTNYTFFFREPDYVSQLPDPVLSDFLAAGGARMRVWSAACSSGQEAYSVAMTLEGYRRATGARFDFDIVGTDINTDMLDMAARGVYSGEEWENIPAPYRRFVSRRADGGVEVVEDIRRKVAWRYGNLLDGAEARGAYDVVFCRNVMIYFEPRLRREMTARLHDVIAPGGYLFTGTTESIDLERKYFQYIAPAFYRKR